MWLRDLKYAIRVLGKAKGSSGAAVLILALAIGANTAVFTLLDRLLFQPLPVAEPSRLMLVTEWSHTIGSGNELRNGSTDSNANYLYYRDHNQTFAGMAAEAILVARERRANARVGHPAEAIAVSGNFFSVLGVRPLRGRTISPADDIRGGSSRVAAASYRFWNRRYNRTADVLGSTVYLNKVSFTIVGVMPSGFHGVRKGDDPDLYVPLSSLPDLFSFDPLQNGGFLEIFGRLAPGVSRVQAQSNLQVLLEQNLTSRIASAERTSPKLAAGLRKELAGSHVELKDGSAGYAGTQGEKRRSLTLLFATAAILLLIGCANVAALQMARGVARTREMAIRFLLGAGKGRILGQSLLESGLISLAGGAAGVLVAFWAGRLLLIAFQWQNRPIDLSPDARILAFALAAALAAGILSGLAPALQLLRNRDLTSPQGITAPRLLAGKGLVVLEIALSLVLVAGATIFTRSFENLRAAPVGFSREHVSVIRLASSEDPDEQPAAPLREAMLLARALGRNHGVGSVGLSDFLMFNDSSAGTLMTTRGVPVDYRRGLTLLHVDQGYFETLGIRLLRGRGVAATDGEHAPKVAVLSENAARRFFGSQSPIGQMVFLGEAAFHPKPENATQVVGVVNDVKFRSVAAPAPEVVYAPILQRQSDVDSSTMVLQVRSSMQPPALRAVVQSQVQAARMPVAIQSAGPLEDEILASLQTDHLRMQASNLFGVIALLLIIAGTYGLMAYSVTRRTREIGIRIAVGSTPSRVLELILKECMRLALLGVLAGIPGAVMVMKAVSGLVFGLSPVDPASLAIAAFVLMATSVVAGAVPAWRAARVDPVHALRLE